MGIDNNSPSDLNVSQGQSAGAGSTGAAYGQNATDDLSGQQAGMKQATAADGSRTGGATTAQQEQIGQNSGAEGAQSGSGYGNNAGQGSEGDLSGPGGAGSDSAMGWDQSGSQSGTTELAEHMHVHDADGNHVGTIDHIDGDRIKLTKNDSPDGQHHYLDRSDVQTIEEGRAILRVGVNANTHS